MTFFSAQGPFANLPAIRDAGEARDPRDRRRWTGWVLILAAMVVTLALAFAPSPYVIETPGPAYDTLGEVGSGDSATPLISISGAETYPTEGSLDLLTVSVVGSPSSPANFFAVALAWFDRTKSVQPLEAIFQPGITGEQQQEQSRTQMVNSQQEAVAAALTEVGYSVTGTVTVAAVPGESPAAGLLQEGDVITSVDSTPITDLPDLRSKLEQHGTATPAAIGITRGGVPSSVEVTPVDRSGSIVLGVGVSVSYDFPVKVDIELPNVGGPSAGMMFALGIYDKLTDGALTDGTKVAGTGTIDAAGEVGPIGGIRQKLFGAKAAGASLFLAPEANCDEVEGHIPDGMTVVAVSTLDDAITAIRTVTGGGDVASLPSCEPVEG